MRLCVRLDPGLLTGNDACHRLVALTRRLADESGRAGGRPFLLRLGAEAAGIRVSVPGAYVDLARGGRNLIAGRGFTAVYDDASYGQVRHFAGTVAARVHLGRWLTLALTRYVRGDSTVTPDGKLSGAAVSFADEVLAGKLPVSATPLWIERTLCDK